MAWGRGVVGQSEQIPPPQNLRVWPLFPCPTATSLPVLINPARPGQYRGVPKHSGFDFFWFFIDFAALRTLEIIEKPLKNLGFCVIFAFLAKSLPNQKI